MTKPGFVETRLEQVVNHLTEGLKEVDWRLASLEDHMRGEDGMEITRIRGFIHDLGIYK